MFQIIAHQRRAYVSAVMAGRVPTQRVPLNLFDAAAELVPQHWHPVRRTDAVVCDGCGQAWPCRDARQALSFIARQRMTNVEPTSCPNDEPHDVHGWHCDDGEPLCCPGVEAVSAS